MKLLIVSDSHGDQHILAEILERHIVDQVVHCGDSEIPREWFQMRMVRGNSWNDDPLPDELLLELDGSRVYVTHGHKFGVYTNLQRLYYKAKSLEVDYCLYGHTHIAKYEEIDNVIFINPGSIVRPRDNKASYMILETDTGECIHYETSGKEIMRYERSN